MAGGQAGPLLEALAERAAAGGLVCRAGAQFCPSWLESRRVVASAGEDAPWLERPDVFCVRLDNPFGRLGCVVMASGLGRRFGGNKLLAELEGKPLLQYALDVTGGIFARRVVVTRHPDAARLCTGQGVETVLHSEPSRSDTVRLGMEALAGAGLTGVLFCPADQPLLGRETVLSLALCAAGCPEKIWRPAWQGKPGAPVLFPRWAFEELGCLPAGQGGGAVLRRYPDRVGLVPARSARELEDVDYPRDLEALRAFLRAAQEEKTTLSEKYDS